MSPEVLAFLESLKTFEGFVITEDYQVYHRDTFLMSFDSDGSSSCPLGSLATNRIATILL